METRASGEGWARAGQQTRSHWVVGCKEQATTFDIGLPVLPRPAALARHISLTDNQAQLVPRACLKRAVVQSMQRVLILSRGTEL